MSVADESLAELFEQYKDEVRESIGKIDSELVAIEQDPSNSEVIFSLFRHLHSLKGSSKMFNVDNIGHIAHKLEDLMQIIDKDNTILARNTKIIDLLFRGNDIFREVITRLEDDISFINITPDHAKFIEMINRQIDKVSGQDNPLLMAAQRLLEDLDSVVPTLDDLEASAIRKRMSEVSSAIRAVTQGDGASDQVRYSYSGVDLTEMVVIFETGVEKFGSGDFTEEDVKAFMANAENLINALFEVAEEDIMGVLTELNDGLEMFETRSLEIDPVVIEFFTAILTDLKGRLHKESGGDLPEAKPVETAAAAPTPEAAAADEHKQPTVQKTQTKTIRVDEKKIDHFLDSVGKLITQSEILNHLQFSFREAGINPALVRDFAAVNRAISSDIVNLQRSLMEVRQVEMDNILKKFPRLVRDISHRMNKEVELIITGERVPIDKSLLDDVEAAMIHLVRNSIDHGLETPGEREAAGKSRRGRISIRVLQEEASIKVELEDDGKGIDVAAVRRKAMEKGLLNREQLNEISDEDALNLIFASGMTTKNEATDISGRGVGLDVVSSNIRKWNGEVLLENRPGQGLTFTLHIPITNTLLTKEAILLRLGTGLFCMPLENVEEIIQLPPGQLHRHKDQYIFQHRDSVVTVVDIKLLLGMACSTGGDPTVPHTFVLLRGKKNNRQAICAEEIVGQQKIVIKDFDLESFRQLPYYQGLTLMGDGRVVLVLDAEAIVE